MRLLAFLLLAFSTHAATVQIALTNFYAQPLASNTILQLFYTNVPVANSPWMVTGIPIRIIATNGYVSTNLLPGPYSMTVVGQTWASPLKFNVPNDSETYALPQLVTNAPSVTNYAPFVISLIAGSGITLSPTNGRGNVTITSTGGGTSGAITNNETRAITFSNDVTIAGTLTVNSTNAATTVSNLVASGTITGDGSGITNLSSYLKVAQTQGVEVDWSASDTALSIRYHGTAKDLWSVDPGNHKIWQTNTEINGDLIQLLGTIYGNGSGLTNGHPNIATNTAADGQVLSATGTHLKWVANGAGSQTNLALMVSGNNVTVASTTNSGVTTYTPSVSSVTSIVAWGTNYLYGSLEGSSNYPATWRMGDGTNWTFYFNGTNGYLYVSNYLGKASSLTNAAGSLVLFRDDTNVLATTSFAQSLTNDFATKAYAQALTNTFCTTNWAYSIYQWMAGNVNSGLTYYGDVFEGNYLYAKLGGAITNVTTRGYLVANTNDVTAATNTGNYITASALGTGATLTAAQVSNSIPAIITNATSALLVSNNIAGVPANGSFPMAAADGKVVWTNRYSWTAFSLASQGTNVVISPTNGNLQKYTITNVANFTLDSLNTNNTETIRLELTGSNALAWTTANLSNSANLTTTASISVFLFDRAGGTNLWWAYKLR